MSCEKIVRPLCINHSFLLGDESIMANRHRRFEIENGHSLIYPINIVLKLSVLKNS